MDLKTGMCEYLFLYNIANGENRTSDNGGDNGKGESGEDRSGPAPDDSGMFYSCNIIILN
jgi:hypothetical protein